jgi:hypothetical protein
MLVHFALVLNKRERERGREREGGRGSRKKKKREREAVSSVPGYRDKFGSEERKKSISFTSIFCKSFRFKKVCKKCGESELASRQGDQMSR